MVAATDACRALTCASLGVIGMAHNADGASVHLMMLMPCGAGGEHEHEMQCTLQGISAPQPIRPVRTNHTASHLEQRLSLHPTGADHKLLPRNTAFAASHLEANNTLHPK